MTNPREKERNTLSKLIDKLQSSSDNMNQAPIHYNIYSFYLKIFHLADWLSESLEDEVLLIDLRTPEDEDQIMLSAPEATEIPTETLLESSVRPPPLAPPPLSPLPSPLHGSCLTPRKLMSQANSPLLPVRSARNKLQPSPLALTGKAVV